MLPQKKFLPQVPSKTVSGGPKIPPRPPIKPPPPKAPTTIFGEKKYWTKPELKERIKKISSYILSGKVLSERERTEMVERWFPYERYGTYIDEGKTKRALRELRHKEYWAKSSQEKKAYSIQRKLLEAFTGIKKY